MPEIRKKIFCGCADADLVLRVPMVHMNDPPILCEFLDKHPKILAGHLQRTPRLPEMAVLPSVLVTMPAQIISPELT